MNPDQPAAEQSPGAHTPGADAEFLRTLIAPVLPHDHYGFDELRERYNFANISDRRAVLTRMIIDECDKREGPVRVLDIGCGEGIGQSSDFVRAIKAHAGEMWGIEPAEDIEPPEGIFDHTQHALMETADLPEAYFDVAYSYMVMEHVVDPEGFMRAVARVLKPGGVYFFVTPNGNHYFTLAASTLKKLRLEEAVLRILRGKSQVEDYHYPVQYRFNRAGVIRRVCEASGAGQADLVYMEKEGPRPYMRGPLVLVFHALRFKRRVIRSKASLLTIIGRVRKP